MLLGLHGQRGESRRLDSIYERAPLAAGAQHHDVLQCHVRSAHSRPEEAKAESTYVCDV